MVPALLQEGVLGHAPTASRQKPYQHEARFCVGSSMQGTVGAPYSRS
jgi:hypothetical protein